MRITASASWRSRSACAQPKAGLALDRGASSFWWRRSLRRFLGLFCQHAIGILGDIAYQVRANGAKKAAIKRRKCLIIFRVLYFGQKHRARGLDGPRHREFAFQDNLRCLRILWYARSRASSVPSGRCSHASFCSRLRLQRPRAHCSADISGEVGAFARTGVSVICGVP